MSDTNPWVYPPTKKRIELFEMWKGRFLIVGSKRRAFGLRSSQSRSAAPSIFSDIAGMSRPELSQATRAVSYRRQNDGARQRPPSAVRATFTPHM
jgi:hypothetical protein